MTQRRSNYQRTGRLLAGAKHLLSLGLTLVLLSSTAILNAAEPTAAIGRATMSSGTQVEFSSALSPLAINNLHSWVIKLRDANGAAIEGATLVFDAGMPEHDHGLPTQPQTTAEIRPGEYLVEGVRFHMNGHWLLSISVTRAGRDAVESAELSVEI